MFKRFMLFCILPFILSACSISAQPYAVYSADEEKQAQIKIAEIRADWNAEQFKKLFDEGGPKFTSQAEKSLVIAKIQQAFVQYGTFEKSVDSKFKVLIVSPLQVRAAFHSTFQKSEVSERMTLIKINGVYKLDGYLMFPKAVDLDKLLSDDY